MENRRESLVAFVLFIALLFFCILMGLVPLLAGTPAGNTNFNFVVETFSHDDAFYDPTNSGI